MQHEPATHDDLGQFLASMIDQLEAQRVFAGDLIGEFLVPLDDGSAYRVTVERVTDSPRATLRTDEGDE